MSFLGTIVSYDHERKAGLVTLEGSVDSLVFFQHDLHFSWKGSPIGHSVTFDVVQTPQGIIAINLRKFSATNGTVAGVVAGTAALLGAALLTYVLTTVSGIDPAVSYLLSVNAITAAMVVLSGKLLRASKPFEVVIWILAIGGGGLALLVTFATYSGRLKHDSVRLVAAALTVLHVFVVHRYRPELFTRTTIKKLFSVAPNTKSDGAKNDTRDKQGYKLEPSN